MLPTGFFDARNFPFIGQLAETDSAQAEVSHISVTSSTLKATICRFCGKFRLFRRSRFDGCFGHEIKLAFTSWGKTIKTARKSQHKISPRHFPSGAVRSLLRRAHLVLGLNLSRAPPPKGGVIDKPKLQACVCSKKEKFW